MLYCYREGKHTYFRAQEGYDGPVRLVLEPSQWESIRHSFGKRPIEVCSVNLVQGCSNPDEVLEKMSTVNALPIGGGWRALLEQEVYALYVSRMNALEELQHFEMRPEVSVSLSRHPLMASGVTFAFGGVLTLQLITLMQDIYDIIRFNDPEHPTRRRKLKAYFRLDNPTTIMQLMTGETPSNISQIRTCIAVQGWKMQPLRELPREQLDAHPEAFLFRDFWTVYDNALKQHNEEQAHCIALWRTTERFLVYVRQLWLSGLRADPFQPERFFKRPDEVDAYLKYTKPAGLIELEGTGA